MTTVLISQPMLFPWVGMYEQIALADVYVHYDDVKFSKGSFTNRVQIKSARGTEWLTIPLRGRRSSTLIAELEAAEDRGWRDAHVRLLQDHYIEAPFLDETIALLTEVYRDGTIPLARVLERSMELVAEELGLLAGTLVHRSSRLGISGQGWQRVLDIVRALGGDVYVTGHGARRYLDHAAFEAAGIDVRYMDYARVPYPQLHGAFTPFVSVLDLIANVGISGAASYVQPRTVGWREFLARS